MSLVAVMERKGKRAALEQRVRQHFGVELPRGPKRAVSGDLAWMGVRFDSWLVTRPVWSGGLCEALRQAVSDAASVVEQSDGMSVVQLSGRQVRDILCRLVPVDVDRRVFSVHDIATTMMAGIRITLWRIDDLPDGASVFELGLPRSYIANLLRVLAHAIGNART